jgi:hypothetical protein
MKKEEYIAFSYLCFETKMKKINKGEVDREELRRRAREMNKRELPGFLVTREAGKAMGGNHDFYLSGETTNEGKELFRAVPQGKSIEAEIRMPVGHSDRPWWV